MSCQSNYERNLNYGFPNPNSKTLWSRGEIANALQSVGSDIAESYKLFGEGKNATSIGAKMWLWRNTAIYLRNAYIFCTMTHWRVEAMIHTLVTSSNALQFGSFDYGFYYFGYFP